MNRYFKDEEGLKRDAGAGVLDSIADLFKH